MLDERSFSSRTLCSRLQRCSNSTFDNAEMDLIKVSSVFTHSIFLLFAKNVPRPKSLEKRVFYNLCITFLVIVTKIVV